jgi:bifunctional non-homologous end joining protein LigD
VRLESRTGKDLTGTYPDVRAALEEQRLDRFMVDGEVVVFDGDQTSFSRLQQRLGTTRPSPALVDAYPAVYCVFDLLEAGGEDLTAQPLVERRARLERDIRPTASLQISEAWSTDSEGRFAKACGCGWEGLIAKRADAPYAPGRSRDWLKLKCVLEQEFVVLGWTDPQRSRHGIGALLVGYFDGGDLRYAGKVGTGFNQRELDRLAEMLAKRERARPPLGDTTGVQKKGVHWAKPDLVAQVGFGEWTPDGKLRHPRYLGLRDDKAATEVVRER